MVDEYKSPRVILYYTHNKLEEGLAGAVRKRLNKICGPIPIYSVSQQPLKFGKNICVGEKPLTYQTMYEQIRDGLKAIPANSIVYLCEHDVFYHASHFAMLPKDNRHVWFNTNRYYWAPGMNGFYPARGKRALSQGVAYRDCWLRHVEDRLEEWKTNPETKMKVSYFNYRSERPNVDVRNGQNLTIAGHYKRKHERGELPNETNLPGWGTVKHFLSVVGYAPAVGLKEEKLNAQAYLAKKYGRRMPQPSPIRCPGLKRRSLPKIWQACGYSKGAEVGVRQGHFSEIICKAMPGLSLSCVDIWGEYYHFDSEYGKENLALCKKRLAPYKVEFINKPSVEAAMSMEDNALDFVYIDADHRFDYVMEDLIWWNRKVRPGGIVSGHDYYRFRNAGVVPAVDVFTYNHDIREWFITDEKEASFFWVKPDKDGFH